MAQTLGKQLARKRESEGMSVEDIAHRTRISAHIVRSLENDDYSPFPNLVYARSFLRLYSQHLEVDATTFLDELRQAGEAKPARPARTGLQYFRSQVTPAEVEEMAGTRASLGWFPWRTILSALFFIAVLGAGGYVILQLWNEHARQKVVEDSGKSAAPSEESLIGEGLTAPPVESVGEEDPLESAPGPGSDLAEEEVVPRALPAEPPPAETGGVETAPGDAASELATPPAIEGPEENPEGTVSAAGTVVATGTPAAPPTAIKPANAPSPN